jgi:hypothetical protein
MWENFWKHSKSFRHGKNLRAFPSTRSWKNCRLHQVLNKLNNTLGIRDEPSPKSNNGSSLIPADAYSSMELTANKGRERKKW